MNALGDSTQITTSQIIIAAASGNTHENEQTTQPSHSRRNTARKQSCANAINYFLKLFRLLAMMQEGLNANNSSQTNTNHQYSFKKNQASQKHLTQWTPKKDKTKHYKRLSKAEAETRKRHKTQTQLQHKLC